MTAEWQAEDASDAAWLLYSANYLLRTGAARWALDPLTLRWRVPEAERVPARQDLAGLSFVVLTHRHKDHLDLDLLRTLRDVHIPWIVPAAMLEEVVGGGRLLRSQAIVAAHGKPIEIEGVRLTPFPGLHFEGVHPSGALTAPSAARGVPSTGYVVEWDRKRWLFPGDIRDYRAGVVPVHGALHGVFAHVWLGRGAALDKAPPLVESQAEFCLRLHPRRIVLTHLEEFGRPSSDLWTRRHAALLKKRMTSADRDVRVEVARTGDRIPL